MTNKKLTSYAGWSYSRILACQSQVRLRNSHDSNKVTTSGLIRSSTGWNPNYEIVEYLSYLRHSQPNTLVPDLWWSIITRVIQRKFERCDGHEKTLSGAKFRCGILIIGILSSDLRSPKLFLISVPIESCFPVEHQQCLKCVVFTDLRLGKSGERRCRMLQL